MNYLKADQISTAKWRVLAIPFGGPLDSEAVAKLGKKRPNNGGAGFDFDGEFFSKNTDIKPDWFDRRPLIWHHNLDRNMKTDPVLGDTDDLELKDDGWWTTMWLNRSHEYWARVDALLREGKIYGSSGTLGNFAKTDPKTGEIQVWPYVEQTLTPTPSNYYSVAVAAKAIDHFDGAGIGLSPAVRALLSDLDSRAADLRDDLPSDRMQAPDAKQRLSGAIDELAAKAAAFQSLIKS